MKKKYLLTCFIMIMFFMFSNDVKGYIYNGEVGSTVSGSFTTYACESYNPYCTSDNSDLIVIKATVYYINNGTFEEKVGKSIYLVNSKADNAISGVEKIKIEKLDGCTGDNRYSCARKELFKYFGAREADDLDPSVTPEGENFLNRVTEQSGKEGYLNVLSKESEAANPSESNAASKGYRIILEPARIFKHPIVEIGDNSYIIKQDGFVLLTAKELANLAISQGTKVDGYHYKTHDIKNADSGWYIPSCTGTPGAEANGCNKKNPLLGVGSFAQVFFTSFKDVGISAQSESMCEKVNIDNLANITNGCGYHILDISQYADPPKCYDRKTTETNGGLKCINTDQNNTATYEETYNERTCEKEKAEQSTTSKYGQLINKKNESCNVYCIESAFASFPGSISGSLPIDTIGTRGTYFAWPARIGTPGMTMLMRTTLKCTIVQSKGKTCSKKKINDLIENVKDSIKNKKMGATLQAGTNKEIDSKLTEYNTRYNGKYDIKDVSLNVELNDGVSNTFDVTKESYFKIPEDKNRLYDKESGKVYDGTSTSSLTVYDRGEGVISLKKDDSQSKIYDLKISDIELGAFTGNLKDTSYVCTYKIKKDDCVCPEGTLREGESLYEELVSGKTCSELQVTSCNICMCPPNSKNEYEILNVGENATTKVCKQLQDKNCYGDSNYCTYDGKRIDLTDCIKTQKEKNGLTENEAKTYCEQTLCPVCTNIKGEKIDLAECLKTGNSYTICKALECPREICVDGKCYTCSENCSWKLQTKTNTTIEYKKSCSDGNNCGYIKLSCPSGDEKMNNADDCLETNLGVDDITTALNNGTITDNDVRTAFAACESEVCPYSGSKIIYRQIDLTDPFPGKNYNGDWTLTFNSQNIKMRKPGDNWNSTTTITTKILNARGANGYELYNKDPLYIIELTPSTIRKIREYNKKTSYDDFNLTCTNKNESANCISDFLHKAGTIDNLNPSDFIKTSYGNKKSVSACYNMSYDEESFNKCYNQNN